MKPGHKKKNARFLLKTQHIGHFLALKLFQKKKPSKLRETTSDQSWFQIRKIETILASQKQTYYQNAPYNHDLVCRN